MCSLAVWEHFFGAEKRIVEDIAVGLLQSNVQKSFVLVQMRELRLD